MNRLIEKFNTHVPWPVRLGIIAVIGLSLKGFVPLLIYGGWAVTMKLTGQAVACPWPKVFSYYSDQADFSARFALERKLTATKAGSDSMGLRLASSPVRDFWVKERFDDEADIPYLLAEHKWIDEQIPGAAVRPGDIVLDCGAHVGAFTHRALELGAARVVAIEPDPVNVESIRRSFRHEIEEGRVILVPEGVWSSETTLLLSRGIATSQNSFVNEQQGDFIEVPVTTIDWLVERLELPRVDYIKMDIEGAEREALKGASMTMRKFRPRLRLDSYHLRDDMIVLPELIYRANSDYSMHCGPCRPLDHGENLLVPHAVLFE